MIPGRIIYIIGFMGCGKTTAGKKLAAALGWQYADLDKLIEEETGKKIPEIFEDSGETGFRETETRVLRGLQPDSDMVVSTGGGTPCFNQNMEFMLKTGLTIYLQLSPVVLKSRLENSSTVRPLIKDIKNEDLEAYIAVKLSEREEWYNRADLIVDAFSCTGSCLADLVLKRLEG